MKSLLVLLWFLVCSGICQAIGTTKVIGGGTALEIFQMEVVALFASVFCCTESLMKVDVDEVVKK